MTAKIIRLPVRGRAQPIFMIVPGKHLGTWVVRYSDDERVMNVPPVTRAELRDLRDTIDLMLTVTEEGGK